MMRQAGKAFDGKPYARNPRMRLDEAEGILRRADVRAAVRRGGRGEKAMNRREFPGHLFTQANMLVNRA